MSKKYWDESEYYCTNCNATLNFQDGFDPSLNHWRCTECGQIFNGDDSTTWVCDNCNAILNNQYGFSDDCDYWDCTECGHRTPIGDDYIIDGDVRKCPNCNAVLNYQRYYRDYEHDWTCTECNTNLHREYSSDDFEIVKEPENESPTCPNCGAELKNQWAYNDWNNDYTCLDCGTILHRDYASADFEIVEKDNGEDDDENNDATYSAQSEYEINSHAYTIRHIRKDDRISDILRGIKPPSDFPLINIILASVWCVALLMLTIISSIPVNENDVVSPVAFLFLIGSCILTRFMVWSQNCIPRIIISSGWITTLLVLTVLVVFYNTRENDMPLIMSFLCLSFGCISIPNVITCKNNIPKLITILGLLVIIALMICLLSTSTAENTGKNGIGIHLFFAIVTLVIIFIRITIKSTLTENRKE